MSMILHMLGCGIHGASASHRDERFIPGRSFATHAENIWNHAWQVELRNEPERALPLYRAAVCDSAAPRWALQRLRALEMLAGHSSAAILIARKLVDSGTVTDSCILGGLLLQNGRYADAASELQRAAMFLLSPPTSESAMTRDLDQCIQDGAVELRMGRYVRAQDHFEQAGRRAELALSVCATWHCALRRCQNHDSSMQHLHDCLQSLGTLTDSLLRYSARTRLASNLAIELRKKQLRADLAPWATGTHDVKLLLQAEYQRLSRVLAIHWNHAELRYRLGLLARAIGRPDAAERHLRGVLAVHPHYVPAAARLGSMLLTRGQSVDDLVDQTIVISLPTLKSHYALAMKSQNTAAFDQAILQMEQGGTNTSDPRANIAFALGMLGLLDEELCEWKNAVAQAA